MKFAIRLLIALVLAAVCGFGQDATFFQRAVGANVGICPSCAPQVNGGVWYANRITSGDHPTYSFSLVNIDKVQVSSWKPLDLQVVTSAETGFAQHATRFGRFDVFAVATGGVAADSTNTGFALNGSALALTPIGRSKQWLIGPYFRVGKATIVDGVSWKLGVTVVLGSN